jgi:hypothetical protein
MNALLRLLLLERLRKVNRHDGLQGYISAGTALILLAWAASAISAHWIQRLPRNSLDISILLLWMSWTFFAIATGKDFRRKSMQRKMITHNLKPADPWPMLLKSLATPSFQEHPRWLLPILVSGVISALVNFYVIQRIGFIRLIQAATQEKAVIDAEGVLENALANKNQILVIQAATSFVGPFLITLAVATVLWLLLALLGYNIPFKTNLAIAAHANMLAVVIKELMLVLTITIIPDITNFDLNNPLATNLAFFFKPISPTLLRLFSHLDALTFLNMAIIIIGLNRVCPKLSKGAAALMIGIPWTLYLACILITPFILS